MADKLKSKRVCVVDNGLFVHTALTLARDFGEVYYYMPWKNAFPKWNQTLVGDGFDEIKRVLNFWDIAPKIDLFVFPDVYDGDLQLELERQGKRVWGSRKGEQIELNRWWFRNQLPRIGLPKPPGVRVMGFKNLRAYLRDNDNKWVKISTFRGMGETWHHETYELSGPVLDEREYLYGAVNTIVEFVVDDALDDSVEVGYDGFCIDGKYPDWAGLGVETKDLGLIMFSRRYKELPSPVLEVNSAIAPMLRDFRYRNWFSSEIRYQNDKPYLTDPCCRQGTPSSEILMELFENWAEIVWEGAAGRLVQPEPKAKYGVEIMIHSQWADRNWQAVEFPDELKQWVKLRNVCRLGDNYYAVPQTVGLPEIGAVVAVGDSLAQTTRTAIERCQQVKGYYIDCKVYGLDKTLKDIKTAQQQGIDFGMDDNTAEELANALEECGGQ